MLISCKVVHMSQKAVLVELGAEGSDDKKWIPYSVIDAGLENLAKGAVVDIEVKDWFAQKERLES